LDGGFHAVLGESRALERPVLQKLTTAQRAFAPEEWRRIVSPFAHTLFSMGDRAGGKQVEKQSRRCDRDGVRRQNSADECQYDQAQHQAKQK
jgi:hypothetical protein